MKNRFFMVMVAVALVIAACSTAPSTTETTPTQSTVNETVSVGQTEPTSAAVSQTEVSFNKDVWPIIEQYALAAHGGKGGVFLESYDDIMKYVTPGDPENSMLYKELIGDGVELMPPSAPLPDELIQTIYDWIKQGAKNN